MANPVVRAEAFYAPPPELEPDAWDLVPPAERVWRWVEYRQQRRVVPPEGFLLGESVWAGINHNRWVVDCPCGSAQVVTPDDPRFACTECGYGWVTVTFPDDVAGAEDAITAELPHLRNWTNPAIPRPASVLPPPPPKRLPPPGPEVSP